MTEEPTERTALLSASRSRLKLSRPSLMSPSGSYLGSLPSRPPDFSRAMCVALAADRSFYDLQLPTNRPSTITGVNPGAAA